MNVSDILKDNLHHDGQVAYGCWSYKSMLSLNVLIIYSMLHYYYWIFYRCSDSQNRLGMRILFIFNSKRILLVGAMVRYVDKKPFDVSHY